MEKIAYSEFQSAAEVTILNYLNTVAPKQVRGRSE